VEERSARKTVQHCYQYGPRDLAGRGGGACGAYKETFNEPFGKGVVSKPGAVSGAWLGGNFGRMPTLDAFCSQTCYIVYEAPFRAMGRIVVLPE